MSDINNPHDWIAKAEEDYAASVSALRRKTPLPYISTFHSQQCAEKYLKAMLVARKEKFPKIHDLVKINALCEAAGILTGFSDSDLVTLSAYAVETRYPGDIPTLEEAREALETVKAVRKFSRKFLGIT